MMLFGVYSEVGGICCWLFDFGVLGFFFLLVFTFVVLPFRESSSKFINTSTASTDPLTCCLSMSLIHRYIFQIKIFSNVSYRSWFYKHVCIHIYTHICTQKMFLIVHCIIAWNYQAIWKSTPTLWNYSFNSLLMRREWLWSMLFFWALSATRCPLSNMEITLQVIKATKIELSLSGQLADFSWQKTVFVPRPACLICLWLSFLLSGMRCYVKNKF